MDNEEGSHRSSSAHDIEEQPTRAASLSLATSKPSVSTTTLLQCCRRNGGFAGRSGPHQGTPDTTLLTRHQALLLTFATKPRPAWSSDRRNWNARQLLNDLCLALPRPEEWARCQPSHRLVTSTRSTASTHLLKCGHDGSFCRVCLSLAMVQDLNIEGSSGSDTSSEHSRCPLCREPGHGDRAVRSWDAFRRAVLKFNSAEIADQSETACWSWLRETARHQSKTACGSSWLRRAKAMLQKLLSVFRSCPKKHFYVGGDSGTPAGGVSLRSDGPEEQLEKLRGCRHDPLLVRGEFSQVRFRDLSMWYG